MYLMTRPLQPGGAVYENLAKEALFTTKQITSSESANWLQSCFCRAINRDVPVTDAAGITVYSPKKPAFLAK